MTIVPDDKDWTWVLDSACPECGFETGGWPVEQVAGMIRGLSDPWQTLLAADNAAERTVVGRWSALEYGCHVRDVLRLYEFRLGLMLEHDNPSYPNWDQDATALEERYGDQDPSVVSGELRAAAESLADRFDGVSGEQWRRPGRRSDGAVFTIESFARYLIHDPLHHLWDVTGTKAG